MASGTFVAQAVLALSSPVLTRLFSPAEFGVLAVFTSILGVIVPVASLRYEAAIPLPRESDDAKRITSLSLLLVTAAALSIGCAIGVARFAIAHWLGAPALARYWWLLPLGIMGMGTFRAINMWIVRNEAYGLLSQAKVLQALLQVSFQLAGGVFHLGLLGLFGGYVLGRVSGAAYLVRRAALRPLPEVAGLRRLAARYRDFPLFYAPAALINSAGIELPPLLFARFFSLDVAGYFSLTLRILTLPIFLIGQATGQVFYPQASSLGDEPDGARALVERVATAMLLVGLPLFAFLGLAGPELFAWVFGPEWRTAGTYARLLTPWFFIALIVTPVTTFALVKERQRTMLSITIAESALRLFIITFGGRFLNADVTVALYGIVGAGINAFYLRWVFRLAGSSMSRWAAHHAGYLGAGLSAIVALAFLPRVAGPGPVTVAAQAVVLGVVALIFIVRHRSRIT